MGDLKMSETCLTSAAAFVEGGIQDACDDSCSICLEDFSESDPATVTGCKHEFHLQCILEWCQRSSQCPMCMQSISLKDPSSQELLDAVEHERNIQMNPPRNTAIFHHPTLGDFELQHLPVNATETELEERIIQHLAAAAAMGSARHLARREGQRGRSSSQGRPHFLVFSTHPSGPAAAGSSPNRRSGTGPTPAVMISGPNSPFTSGGEDSAQFVSVSCPVQANQVSSPGLGSSTVANTHGTSSGTRGSPTQSSPSSQERAGPSDIPSFSESLKSRFSALSMRYKESITKSTRGWKERFSRNSSTPGSGSEARREADAEAATPSHSMGHLETTAESRMANASISNNLADSLPSQQADQQVMETGGNQSLTEGTLLAPCAASSASN